MRFRKPVVLVVFLSILIPVLAFGIYAKSSGEKTASAVISAGPCLLTGAMVITDSSNDATLVLYDNASAASGTVLGEFKVAAADFYGGRGWQNPVQCFNGIYASISGTGASYVVEYVPN